MKVRARELALELSLEPQAGLVVLALGTVPVAASCGDEVRMATRLTAIADRAEGLAAAGTDRLDDPTVLMGHRRPEALEVGRAELAEDVLDGTFANLGEVVAAVTSSNDWVKVALCGRWDLRSAAAPYPRREASRKENQ